MPQALVGAAVTAAMPPRSLMVRDEPVTMNIKLAVALADVLVRGKIVFAADKISNMAVALDAGVPAETDVVGILLQDVTPGVAVVAGDPHFMAVEGEFSREVVRAANAGLNDANFAIVEELLLKRGMHLTKTSYGDVYTA